MKKIVIAAMAALLAFSFTACGSGAGTDSKGNEPKQEETSVVEPEAEPDGAEPLLEEPSESEPEDVSSSGKMASLEEYLASPEVKTMLDSAIAEMEDQGLSLEVTAEDNKLIYAYTYQDSSITASEEMKSALEEAAKAQEESMKSIAASLKEVVEVDNPVVVMKYLTSDGTEIATIEFPAE